MGSDCDVTPRVQERTRNAILDVTASALARNRSATMAEICLQAGVSRATVHRYFSDRDRLVSEAVADSLRILDEVVTQAAPEEGSSRSAMRRVIAAMVSIRHRILFLFDDPIVIHGVPDEATCSREPVQALIKRGQVEEFFDPDLPITWIEHVLWALVTRGCKDADSGELSVHDVTPLVIRAFEGGVCIKPRSDH